VVVQVWVNDGRPSGPDFLVDIAQPLTAGVPPSSRLSLRDEQPGLHQGAQIASCRTGLDISVVLIAVSTNAQTKSGVEQRGDGPIGEALLLNQRLERGP
jgi:hypothetical protein